MKDEQDNQTGELLPFTAPAGDEPAREGGPSLVAGKAGLGKKHKRLPHQSLTDCPAGAIPADGMPLGWGRAVVPVSSVARDWGISARRVRVMLQEGRLEGRQRDNGTWEVYFPYRYVMGTRGPQLTRNRKLPDKSPYTRKKPAGNAEW